MTAPRHVDATTPVTSQRLGYRPPLDGLRAIAITYVLLDHALQVFKGGQVGVSIFFPLSGFLITTLIIEEMGRTPGDGFGFRRFWIRRTLRLFPALYTMLAAGIVLAILLRNRAGADLGGQLRWIGRSALYISNLGSSNPRLELGHTWTLGVEEQFYLVWPPLLVLGVRRGWRSGLVGLLLAYATWGIVAGWTGRFGVNNVIGPYNATLALGCVAAMVRSGFVGPELGRRQTEAMSALAWPAMGVIGAAMLLGGGHPLQQSAFDKWFVVAAGVAGIVAMIAVVERPTSLLSRLLSLPPMVHIGKLSYSLYVWHGLVYWVIRASHISGAANPALKLLISYPVAYLSYRLVERPALKLKERYA